MAAPAVVDHQQGPRVHRKGTAIVDRCMHPPPGALMVCARALGLVVPRTFPRHPAGSRTAPSHSCVCYQQFLAEVEAANPGTGDILLITDNLSRHNSDATCDCNAALGRGDCLCLNRMALPPTR